MDRQSTDRTSPRSLRHPTRARLTRALGLGWVFLFAPTLATQALEAPPTAPAAELRQLFDDLAAQAGFRLELLGEPAAAPPADAKAMPGAPAQAVEFLFGNRFNWVEVYEPSGRLERVVAVPRDGASSLGTPVAPRRPVERSRSRRASPAAHRSEMSLAEALATARDREASLAERQQAIAVLSRSGSSSAVEALREVAFQAGGGLRRAAIAGLAGFAGTGAADAARGVLGELTSEGMGNPLDRARVQAAFDLSPLIKQLRNTNNTLTRKNLVHTAAQAAKDPTALTDFLVDALLNDPSATVRSVAALEIMSAGPRVEPRVTAALEKAAANDHWKRVRDAAKTALQVRASGGPVLDPTLAPNLPPEEVAKHQGGRGGRGDRGSGDGDFVLGGGSQ